MDSRPWNAGTSGILPVSRREQNEVDDFSKSTSRLKSTNRDSSRIYFRDILLIRISRGANNCVQRVFEKNIYFIMN